MLRDIDSLLSTRSDLGRCGWVRETTADVAGGNGATASVRAFDLTRDGFTLLVMGWTSARAQTEAAREIDGKLAEGEDDKA